MGSACVMIITWNVIGLVLIKSTCIFAFQLSLPDDLLSEMHSSVIGEANEIARRFNIVILVVSIVIAAFDIFRVHNQLPYKWKYWWWIKFGCLAVGAWCIVSFCNRWDGWEAFVPAVYSDSLVVKVAIGKTGPTLLPNSPYYLLTVENIYSLAKHYHTAKP